MKTTVRMTGDDLFTGIDAQGNETPIDMRAPEVKKASTPMEALLSALGACVGVDVASILKKRRKHVARFSIEVEGKRPERPPRGFTDIHCLFRVVSPDANEEEVEKAAQIALTRYCSVAATLKAKATFSVEVSR